MNNNVRIAGIITVAALLGVVLIFRRDMAEVWGPLIAILVGLLTVPQATQALRARMATKEGNKLTWDEIHAGVMGLGDGLALRKPEAPTYSLSGYEEADYRHIILREAWYYKIPFAIGRLLWVPIILAVTIAILNAASSI